MRPVRCEVKKVQIMNRWACIVYHCGTAVMCKHFDTWSDAYQFAREKVRP
jgi:hypothetical protein